MNEKNKFKLALYPILGLIAGFYAMACQLVLRLIKPSFALKHNLFFLGLIVAVYFKAYYHSYKKELGIIDWTLVIAAALVLIFPMHVNPLLMIPALIALPLIPLTKRINLNKGFKVTLGVFLGLLGYINYFAVFMQAFAPGVNLLTALFMPNIAMILTGTATASIFITGGCFMAKKKTKLVSYNMAPPSYCPSPL